MYNDNDIYEDETDLSEEGRLQLAKEQSLIEEMEDEANSINDDTEPPQRKLLRRELQAQALARLEDSARTQQDFERIGRIIGPVQLIGFRAIPPLLQEVVTVGIFITKEFLPDYLFILWFPTGVVFIAIPGSGRSCRAPLR